MLGAELYNSLFAVDLDDQKQQSRRLEMDEATLPVAFIAYSANLRLLTWYRPTDENDV